MSARGVIVSAQMHYNALEMNFKQVFSFKGEFVS